MTSDTKEQQKEAWISHWSVKLRNAYDTVEASKRTSAAEHEKVLRELDLWDRKLRVIQVDTQQLDLFDTANALPEHIVERCAYPLKNL